MKIEICPCGSEKLFSDCCKPIILKKKVTSTAEALMRSRYTAYTLANVNYLMCSHHSKTRPLKDKKNIKKWAQSVKWMGLKIVNTEEGTENDDYGMVEFIALYIENGKLNQIHEKSIFEKENNLWVYVNGNHYHEL